MYLFFILALSKAVSYIAIILYHQEYEDTYVIAALQVQLLIGCNFSEKMSMPDNTHMHACMKLLFVSCSEFLIYSFLGGTVSTGCM